GGSRISGSPGAAMTSVPQYSPVQPPRRPHAATATTAAKTPTTTRVRMSGKILPAVYRRQVQAGSANTDEPAPSAARGTEADGARAPPQARADPPAPSCNPTRPP